MPPETRLPHFAARKRPRQKRSQIVVGRILATAAALFEQEGYAYVSTNRIAEAANVSIGSIYQYFANRESIALAIYEAACSQAALTLKSQAIARMDLPLAAAIHAHMDLLFDLFERRGPADFLRPDYPPGTPHVSRTAFPRRRSGRDFPQMLFYRKNRHQRDRPLLRRAAGLSDPR
jgi:AcrR family transcriptional regulator